MRLESQQNSVVLILSKIGMISEITSKPNDNLLRINLSYFPAYEKQIDNVLDATVLR